MHAKLVSHKLVGKVLMTFVIALGLVVPTSFLSVGKASAWSNGTSTGSAGTILVDQQIDLYDMVNSSGPYFWVKGDGAHIRRSPFSTGTQNVAAKYLLEQLVGTNWVTIQSSPYFLGQIVAGGFYEHIFPDVNFILSSGSHGVLRVRYLFIWYDDWGHYAGQEIVPNSASDYLCTFVSNLRPCRTGAGFFQIGIYGTNRW